MFTFPCLIIGGGQGIVGVELVEYFIQISYIEREELGYSLMLNHWNED